MKTAWFKSVIFLIAFCLAGGAESGVSYKTRLKKWTRHASVYSWDNLEARVIWHATYLSPEFREARRLQIQKLTEPSADALDKMASEDRAELEKSDIFFVAIYAGSSDWKEVGKNSGEWNFYLQTEDGRVVKANRFERQKVNQLTRELYPYIDKWTEIYLLGFPKTLTSHEKFKLRMGGIPAKSELRWK